MTGQVRCQNPPALKRLIGGGAQLRAFPQDIMEACYKAANEIYAEISRKTNAHFKKIYDSLVPFRNDSYAWFQVAELAFDSFMMRARTRTLSTPERDGMAPESAPAQSVRRAESASGSMSFWSRRGRPVPTFPACSIGSSAARRSRAAAAARSAESRS